MHHQKLYIVDSKILSEVYEKVIAAKDLLRNGDALTIQEACKRVDLSRSAFYKYKDSVFDFMSSEKGKMLVLFMILRHAPGVLSDIINTIASIKGNIITINQTMPIMDSATLTVTVDMKTMEINPEELVQLLLSCKGCRKVDIIGME
ncbi:MAG TPA: ACT domain-containing protein [Patescibacteria group bacterium]|jgi:chorismate mutase|nr:ACT domain-containing protein [Patescibacteria group bacterium]